MKIGMREVAKQAGVSIATVSHVINGTRFVAPETRERVLASIRELNYSPNAAARSFKTGRRNLVGFIVPDIANEFFSTITDAMEKVLAQHNYRLVIVNTKETPERELANLSILASGIVDGLVIASTLEHFDEIRRTVPHDFPMVFIDRLLPGCPCDTIVISNYRSLYQGVENLIDEGHRRIGYIAGLARLSTTVERRRAYLDAMRDHGLPVEEGFIQVADSMANSAVLKARALLDMGCTALVVSNNIMAEDVLDLIYSIEEPAARGISLLGYSESNRRSFVMRRIDRISQPVVELGEHAGEQILERIAHPEFPIRRIELFSTFYPRDGAAF